MDTNEDIVLRSNRLTHSINCLEMLKDFIIQHPEIRLEQLLGILDTEGVDRFYEEPWTTEERWKKLLKEKI